MLNAEKCEIMMFSLGHGAGVIPQYDVDGSQIPVKNTAKSLGYWWRGDLMALCQWRRILGGQQIFLPLYGSLGVFRDTAAMTVLNLDSVTSKIAVQKLGFLKRRLAVGAVGVAAVAMIPEARYKTTWLTLLAVAG